MLAGRLRPVCEACGFVQYRNPAVGVAAVIADANRRLLLCRNARTGGWSFPSGYVEWDEDIRDALTRELAEELGVAIRVGEVIAVHSNFHDRAKQTVGVWFSAQIVSGSPGVTSDEIDDAGYFGLDDLPSLIFPTDLLVIEQLRALGNAASDSARTGKST
jgi:ADP-ribose pyrophosphatase YjhB (NUDIX family)